MSYCININHPEYIQLLQNSNLKPAVLKAKIGVWMEENNSTDFPTLEELNVTSGTVNATLKIIDALEKIQRNVFSQDKLQGWVNDLQKQGASSQQIELFKEVAKPGMTKDQIATSIAASYSYTVEINTAIEKKELGEQPQPFELSNNAPQFTLDGNVYKMRSDIEFDEEGPSNITTFYKNNEQISTQEFIKAKELAAKKNVPTQYYSNLTVPGGTNYTENEIATPEIIPSIKGHAQFATDKGIGWFRSDEKSQLEDKASNYFAPDIESLSPEEFEQAQKDYELARKGSKTRRVLEVQSDLFQKGRDKESLIDNKKDKVTRKYDRETDTQTYYLDDVKISKERYDNIVNNKENSDNQFLQLLNKDNNWVTFFIKSIIQDSAKKGYEKVLFPTGNTASKVEGHSTLEEFKKQKEDRIKELEKEKGYLSNTKIVGNSFYINGVKVFYLTKNIGHTKDGYARYSNKEEIPDTKNASGVGFKYINISKEDEKIFDKSKDQIEADSKKINSINNEIAQLKQELERVEGPEGFAALKPIYNFYENTVKNILNKQYGKENVKQITDEYGNTWNEVSVEVQPAKDTILYQTDRAKSYQQRAKTIYFNEVRGKQLSNLDISNINAKLRKLSDEIGDVNWNLRQSSNTNNYYIAGYKNAPVTMDDYYSPYAGGMFRQLTTQSLESRVEELDKKLMSWARKHGISVEALKAVMEKFPDRYDGTALGIADFAKKLIAVADGARIDTLPEEIAHFAIELLIKDPIVVQALEEVVNTPEYAEVKEDYKDIYEEEIDFRKEALGKILAQEIVTNFKKSQENPNNGFWSKILDIANKFFNWVGTNFSKKSAPRTAIEAVVIPLANSILNQEYLGTLDNIDLNIEEYFVETSVVKSGVQELFDSNPELANQVYEALGFNQLITSNDRIVFGHPTIGKSYLKKQGEDKFISLDDDYATEINNKVKEIADKYNVITYQVKDGGTQKWNNEYNQMMQEMFNVAKQRAISENKTLFTSNTNLLRNNAESFDKVINLTDVEFEKRIQERGAKYNIKEWKSQINEAISKIPTSKVINTNKYLSDLFITPEQKQQALQLYSQYLDTGKQDIEGFKEFVDNPNQKKNKIFYQTNPNAQPVTNSNVEQKKKFLEGVVVQLNNRVKRFKNSAKSQTEIVALNIEITKLQKLIAQSEFDLGINSFAQLASKELDAILSYLNKSLKNKNLNGDKLALAQEFEQTYTSLFLELKKGMYEYEFEETEIDALLAIIDNVENKLKQAEAITTVMRKMLAEKVMEAGNLNAYGEKIDPNFNAKEIVEATDDDMSWWRLWLGNYKFSNSGIIRTAHKIIFDSIAVVKRFTVQTGNEILAAQEKFIKAGYKVEDIIQKDKDGKLTQYFVREHNYHSYYNAIQETKNNIAKALGRDDYSLVQASLLEPADKAIYNKFWNDFFKNNTKTVLQKRDDGTAVEMKVPADKYLEKDFLKKMEDPNFSAYYNLIIEKKREAVNKLPVQYRTENLVYSLPAIRKSFLERITSKDQSYLSKIKGITKESFFVDEDDTIFGDLDSLNNKMVPIHFTRKFDNIADQSFDVARTVTLFAEMAENYREMNRISGDLTAVQSTLAERKYGKKKGIQSSDYQALETMLDTHVFGIEKKNVNFTIPENNFTKKIGIDNKQFSWTKAFQNLASFIRTNNLAFNPATSISGWLKGS
jgi:hypothetical protein